jgi:ATP-dependent Clp protease adapter protein ClpS
MNDPEILNPSMLSQSDHDSAGNEQDVGLGLLHDDLYSVILHNDDHNVREYVVSCLMRVFGHPLELSIRIMNEAHIKGQALAEVEEHDKASLHARQLRDGGLTVSIEKTV